MQVVKAVPTETTLSSRPHITQLDGLRGIAILMVYVFHAFRANLLWMGVDLFFVLSGFLITGILLDQKSKPFRAYIGGFYKRRAKRILPAYFVVLAISAGLFGVAWLKYWYLYLGAMNLLVPMNLTYLKVHPLWSLAVEEQFYLLWPIAVYFLDQKVLSRLSIAAIVVAFVLRFICAPLFESGYAVYMLAPFRMDTLAVGALIAIHWPAIQAKITATNRKRLFSRTFGAIFGIGLVVAIVLNGKGYLPTNGSRIGSSVLLESTLAIAAGMFGLALLGHGKPVLSSRPLVALGRISYSFYLVHMIALTIAPKGNGFIGFLIAVAYSWAMWVFVESPILNFGKSNTAALPAVR